MEIKQLTEKENKMGNIEAEYSNLAERCEGLEENINEIQSQIDKKQYEIDSFKLEKKNNNDLLENIIARMDELEKKMDAKNGK